MKNSAAYYYRLQLCWDVFTAHIKQSFSQRDCEVFTQTNGNKFRQIHICICKINFSFTEKYSTPCHRGTSWRFSNTLWTLLMMAHCWAMKNEENQTTSCSGLKIWLNILISQENMKEIYLFVLKDTNFFSQQHRFYGSVEVSSVSYSSRSFIWCQKQVFWTHKAQWNQETRALKEVATVAFQPKSLIFLLSNSQAFNT